MLIVILGFVCSRHFDGNLGSSPSVPSTPDSEHADTCSLVAEQPRSVIVVACGS